jgi:D-sedoheptulose 7-phosphate isomerase
VTTPSHAEFLRSKVADSIAAKQALANDRPLHDEVAAVVTAMCEALRGGNKVLFFGNGGSSMDAGHLAAELLGRFYLERPALPAVALSDATAAMTAIGNDYAYADVFARQVQGLGSPGDVAVGLSTSGNSANVVSALEVAKQRGLVTVALTGRSGGRAAEVADHALRMPSDDTPRIQECQMLVGHTICELVERELAAES